MKSACNNNTNLIANLQLIARSNDWREIGIWSYNMDTDDWSIESEAHRKIMNENQHGKRLVIDESQWALVLLRPIEFSRQGLWFSLLLSLFCWCSSAIWLLAAHLSSCKMRRLTVLNAAHKRPESDATNPRRRMVKKWPMKWPPPPSSIASDSLSLWHISLSSQFQFNPTTETSEPIESHGNEIPMIHSAAFPIVSSKLLTVDGVWIFIRV